MQFLKKLFKNQWVLSFLVIGGSILAAIIMTLAKPAVQKERPEIRPTLVKTITVESRDEHVVVSAFGTVQANRETEVFSQVSGRIVKQNPNLVLGGLLNKGDVLVRIDPSDYEIAIQQAKAAVERAKFELTVEEGRQLVAKREWDLLDPSIKSTEIGSSLALRKPHLAEKKAAYEGSLSQLAKAELDLSRTIIRSPYNAIVTEESVEVGNLLNPQIPIAKLVSTVAFRVSLSLPYSQLNWIQIPKEGEKGAEALVIQEVGQGADVKRRGEVERLLGTVDPLGRMARLLISIPDPLGLQDPLLSKEPLLLGTYVRVDIEGPLLKDIFVIPRVAIRGTDEVWIKTEQNTLEIRKVGIVLKQEETVIVNSGLESGDHVIISQLATPIPGMDLQELYEKDETE